MKAAVASLERPRGPAVWPRLHPVALAVIMLTPTVVQAQSTVTSSASPSPFTSGTTITITSTLTPGDSPDSWCFGWESCYIVGADPYLEVYGSNGFYQITYDFTAQWQDTQPGQSLQATTYTVVGGVNWTVCWGSTWCQDYYSYSESGQAPPVTVWPTAVPTLDSVSPSSGSVSVQTFTAQYSSAAGGDDITEAWLWRHTTTATSTYSCLVRYIAASHSMALENDAATAWTSAPVGAGPPPQNSQCLLRRRRRPPCPPRRGTSPSGSRPAKGVNGAPRRRADS